MKEDFLKWLRATKLNITRPEKYTNTITTVSNDLSRKILYKINIYDISSSDELLTIIDKYFSFTEYFEKNQTGNRMYSRALDLYLEFLVSNKKVADKYSSDVFEIENDRNLTTLEKEAIILSRIGQGKYRENLIKLHARCAISGFDDPRFLIASHIKPWKKCENREKIDKYNGLLLLPTYDKLFDLGFISFDYDGKILISPQLKNPEKLGITNTIQISILTESLPYFEYHNNVIFKH